MGKVSRIGGVFFRSKNPDTLGAWYSDHLGVDPVPGSYSSQPWSQRAGPSVFVPFPKDSEYLGNANKQWMTNFRVADLDAMVAQLREASIVVSDPESYPKGRFYRLVDPEETPIELGALI